MLGYAYALIYFLLFVTGAVIASFLNVLAYRLPRGISPARGRSFCPACKHTLAAPDLIPIMSYFLLKRRCRYCSARISPRYALVECIGGAMCILCHVAYGMPLFIAYFAVSCILLTIALIDIDTHEIPDGLVIALAVCAVAFVFFAPEVGLLARVIGLFCISVPMLLLSLVAPGAFGGGDIKLMAAAGFLLGWQCALLAMFIGLLTGGVYAVALVARKKAGRKAEIAFGPHLCTGIFVALLFGWQIIVWYMSFF